MSGSLERYGRRPAPPPAPHLVNSNGGSDDGELWAAGNTPGSTHSVPTPISGGYLSNASDVPAPPSVPPRTYKTKPSWTKQRSNRALESIQKYESSRSLREIEAADNADATTQVFEVRAGVRGSPRSSSPSGLDHSPLQHRHSGNDDSSPGLRKFAPLGKSGSLRHLEMQMEKINRISPPSRLHVRAPPPPPPSAVSLGQSAHQEQTSPVRQSSPVRPPPPPPSGTISQKSPVHGSNKFFPHSPQHHQDSPRSSHTSMPKRAPPPPPKTTAALPSQRPAAPATKPRPAPPPPVPPPVPPKTLAVKRRSTNPAPPLKNSVVNVAHKDGIPPSGRKPPVAPPQTAFSSRKLKALEEMQHLRPKLKRFYEIHNPDRLANIDELLAMNGLSGALEGEAKLNELLRKRYGADLSSIDVSTLAPSPTGKGHDNQEERSKNAHAAISSIINSVVEEPGEKKLMFARAQWKFEGEQEGDLVFDAGQIIEVLDNSRDWWTGRYKTSSGKERQGVFPKNYVQEMSEEVALSLRAQEETTILNESTLSETPDVGPKPLSMRKQISIRGGKAAAQLNESADESIKEEYSPELVKEDLLVTHYFKSVFEVVTSEFKYVIDLFMAQCAFATPLANELGKEKSDKLMPCWGDILRIHERLLEMLMDKLLESQLIATRFAILENENDGTNKHESTGSTPGRRQSYSDENAQVLIRIAGASASKLQGFAVKLDLLEDTYSRHLESGRFLSDEQRTERTALISQWVHKMSEIFITMAPFLKAANMFISNYHNALETLEAFSGEDLALLEKLEGDPILKNLKLRDFLIKPVQRVCKYPLLFREIIKHAQDEDTKLLAIKAQSALMTVADQVNTMMKLNESGNAKKLALIKQSIRPQTDVDVYDLHRAVLRREGDIYVVSCRGIKDPPEFKSINAAATQLQTKPKGAVRGLLTQDQLLFIEVNLKFITKAERLRVVQGFSVSQNWESIKVEKVGQDGISLTFTHPEDSPTKGAAICWTFKTPPAARDGWVEDLLELNDRVEKNRERISLARQQEAKIRRRSGSIDWDNNAAAPVLPSRVKQSNARGGLMNLMDELKSVQAHKLEAAKKSMV